ncbi:alpha/beta hydrolase [Actinoplanes sp. N902-109]|uniref:alpha/beta hydrolase n=1 Tax=Actinoplanes sp. (strain N902-109) TaxID=649831 RepID=UPI000329637F|nr:alpha/beta hydrolase [Actinoplanes sp. N902-109]AGL14167.1 peptidase [Actinoplanes sp. N902-109]
MRRILATAAALALVLSGAGAASADPVMTSRDATGYPAISWGSCTDPTLVSAKAECGYLSVPLDYAKPGGTTIKLAVSRIRSTVSPQGRQGVMLVNPGGPGGSGLSLSVLGRYVPAGAGDFFDWIGFDPRGVGASKPALSCDPDYLGADRPQYAPVTAAIEKAWLKRAKGYANDCAKRGGKLLDHMRTTDTVRDMESLRIALGESKINFYGFSYGTYLGQVYATLYPQRVGKMVLDGNVDPGRVWYDANLDQDIAFERTMKIYFGWLARYDKVYHLGTDAKTVERLFYKEQAKLSKKPVHGFGGAELTDVFLQAGYYVFGWEAVATAFSALVNDRDITAVRALFDAANPTSKGADNGYAVYLATQCTDVKWPAAWSKWRADNTRVDRSAPFETWGNAWFNAPCLNWAGKAGKPVAVTGKKVAPVLLLSETLDGATPFTGSLEVRRRFPNAVLVEGVGGTTHAGSLFGNACVDLTVAEYLANGTLPARLKGNTSDKKCPPLPQPDPTAKVAGKSAAGAAGLSRLELQSLIGRR